MVQTKPDETNIFEALGGTITDSLKGFIDKITPKEKRYAPFLPFADTVTCAQQGGFGVMCLKGPTRGRFWYVRKLRISGVSVLGASSNNEWTFSGASNGTANPVISNGGVLQSVSFIYNTSAVVANRVVVFTITEANNRVLYQVVSPFGQPASTSTEYSLGPGLTLSANGSPPSVTMPIPAGIVIPPGGKILITAQSSDVGDTISGGTVLLNGSTRADVFICPDDLRTNTALSQCPITSWRDQLTTIPSVTSYGVGELRVGPQEQLWIAVSNGAIAAQTFVASCEAYEWPDVDETTEWVM